MFPLRYREGGVLVRRGHTEAAVDLARMAGLTPAGVLVEVVNDDGTMKRGQELRDFADEHGLKMISIEQMVHYRRRTESHVERVAETVLPTRHGDFTAFGYRITVDDSEHVALVYGDPASLARRRAGAHPRAQRVPDRRRLRLRAVRLRAAAQRGDGPDRQGGQGSGDLPARSRGPRASACSPSCRPTSSRTAAATPSTPTSTSGCPPTPGTTARRPRSCATSASRSVRLLTNNPDKTASLESYGVPVTERVALTPRPNDHNLHYLLTKRDRMGHQLDGLDLASTTASIRQGAHA